MQHDQSSNLGGRSSPIILFFADPYYFVILERDGDGNGGSI